MQYVASCWHPGICVMNPRQIVSMAFACGVLLLPAASGCNPLETQSIASKVKRMSPEQLFSDPLQVRLARAVDQGDSATVDAAVKDGADVNGYGNDGFSILYWAMARNATAGFEALVRHGADVTAQYRDPSHLSDLTKRDCIIRLALTADNTEFLRAILTHGFDPNYILYEESEETLLFTAVAEHVEPAMQILLDAGASIDHRNCAGFTPMEMAMLGRDYRSAWFLLQRGADPLIQSDGGTDLPTLFKTYGSRGVRPDQRASFEKVVVELINRGLLTRQDIIEADKPKPVPPHFEGSRPGITVIEHTPNSEAGQAIRELDRLEREANERDQR